MSRGYGDNSGVSINSDAVTEYAYKISKKFGVNVLCTDSWKNNTTVAYTTDEAPTEFPNDGEQLTVIGVDHNDGTAVVHDAVGKNSGWNLTSETFVDDWKTAIKRGAQRQATKGT